MERQAVKWCDGTRKKSKTLAEEDAGRCEGDLGGAGLRGGDLSDIEDKENHGLVCRSITRICHCASLALQRRPLTSSSCTMLSLFADSGGAETIYLPGV